LGKVYLVGAGPGDPGLLTLRGKELLERAEVVVFDSLVNCAILVHARNADRIDVGKRSGDHPLPQEEINRILVEQARRAACVVRLKGGDPFVFGRGGEEALALATARVPFEIVPGVTAGIAAPAYAGIPVTHRGLSRSVSFVTAHTLRKDGSADLDLPSIGRDGTLVLFMGVGHLAENVEALIAQGRDPETPAAVIEWGTFPRQRTVSAPLRRIAQRARAEAIHAPSVVVIGEVASLRHTIAWFETRPLFGRRIVVTRTRRRNAELVRLLQERGADVIELPTVEIEPAVDEADLANVASYDWVVLTSPNGVDTLFHGLDKAGLDARALHGVKLCAISAKTAEDLAVRGLRVDLVPAEYESDRVADDLARVSGPLKGQRVLMPRADIGRSSLPVALRKRGAEVTELQAYRTAVPKDAGQATRLIEDPPDYIVFSSGSAARNLAGLLEPEALAALAAHTTFAAIGPIAAETARSEGMPPQIVPEVHRIPELVDAIAAFDVARRA